MVVIQFNQPLTEQMRLICQIEDQFLNEVISTQINELSLFPIKDSVQSRIQFLSLPSHKIPKDDSNLVIMPYSFSTRA